MSEITKPPIILAPGEPFTDEEEQAVVFTAAHSHRDILRHVIADLGEETLFHVRDLLGVEVGHIREPS